MCFSSFSYLFLIFSPSAHMYIALCVSHAIIIPSSLSGIHENAGDRSTRGSRLQIKLWKRSDVADEISFAQLDCTHGREWGNRREKGLRLHLDFFSPARFSLIVHQHWFCTLLKIVPRLQCPAQARKLSFRLTHILTEECTKNLNVFANIHLCTAFRSLAAEKNGLTFIDSRRWWSASTKRCVWVGWRVHKLDCEFKFKLSMTCYLQFSSV